MGSCICKEKNKRSVINVQGVEHIPSTSHPNSATHSGLPNVTVCVQDGPLPSTVDGKAYWYLPINNHSVQHIAVYYPVTIAYEQSI